MKDFEQSAACIVKHATPCGVASESDIASAFVNAYDSDPLAAFGGIIATNRPIDLGTAQRIVEGQKFLEVIVTGLRTRSTRVAQGTLEKRPSARHR